MCHLRGRNLNRGSFLFLHTGAVSSGAHAWSSLQNYWRLQTVNWKGVAFIWTQIYTPWVPNSCSTGRIYTGLLTVPGLCTSGIIFVSKSTIVLVAEFQLQISVTYWAFQLHRPLKFKGAMSQYCESFLQWPKLWSVGKPKNNGLLRKKNTKKVILKQKGTRMAEDAEDWNSSEMMILKSTQTMT